MTLTASLLRELVDPTLRVGGRAELCCELAREFENKGDYEEAREVLSGYWSGIGDPPNLTGLERSTAAEVLLRAGVLTGIIGSASSQIPDAQETAKNLISESLAIFESQRYAEKIAEAQIELALCYWRTGDFNEALDLLKLALAQATDDSELKVKAVIRWGIVEIDAGRLTEALRFLTDNASLVEEINSDMLKGCYHQTLGDAHKDLWESDTPGNYLDRALIEYAAASYHFEQAEHRRYLANLENNLGMIYFRINRRKEAHEHLDRARVIFTNLKDIRAVAQVDETRARVFLQEGRNVEAEKVARSSVKTLEKSDMQLPLAEALTAHGTALARLENYGLALSTFRRAIDVAQRLGSFNRAGQLALTAFQEIGDRLAVNEGGSLVSGRKLTEETHSVEHDLIKHSLEITNGSITRAARALGISYQELNYMLNTRHQDLLTKRTPIRRRRKRCLSH